MEQKDDETFGPISEFLPTLPTKMSPEARATFSFSMKSLRFIKTITVN